MQKKIYGMTLSRSEGLKFAGANKIFYEKKREVEIFQKYVLFSLKVFAVCFSAFVKD